MAMLTTTMGAFALAPRTRSGDASPFSTLSKAGLSSPALLSFRQSRLPTSLNRCSNAFQSMKKVNVKDFGSIEETVGSLTDVEGLRFALVVGRFNEFISKALLSGALETFRRYQIKDEDMEVIWVPGSFEIPIVAQTLAKSGKFDAILCIGVVIRGDTTHYDAVANTAASGVLSAGLNSGVPCIFGVLTCENLDQAINRAGGKAGNKGSEAAVTAIEMATLFKHHLKKLASK